MTKTHPLILWGALADAWMTIAFRQHEEQRWLAWQQRARREYQRELAEERRARRGA